MVKQLKPSNYNQNQLSSAYRDRANERRDKIGSDNPYVKDDKPKTLDRVEYFAIFERFVCLITSK